MRHSFSEEQQTRLEKQFAFIEEIDKEKNIFRQNYLADGSRHENDAEHAWHMAIMVLLLSEYSEADFDKLHTISMLLIHDLVEIYAGDTYAFDESGSRDGQHEREAAAADKLFALLPEDQAKEMRALWDEFEEGATAEAKFARVMDNLQPLLLNFRSGGKSWKEHQVRFSQVLARNQKTPAGSKTLWEYLLTYYLTPAVKNGMLIQDCDV